MKHPIHSYKELLSKLTSLEKKIALFCKKGQQLPTNTPPALLTKWQSLQQLTPILQQQLQQMEEQLPSPSSLDPLYEEVIEWGKKASTKATIENRKAYQTALNNFLEAHKQEPNSNQQLWAAVAAFCKTELVEGKASLEKAVLVKQRIDNLEASEQAKIYCIVKGKEQNGQLWGRIDYVGAAYVMAYANSANGSNNLPLQIRYYTYINGQYQYEGQSNTLQTSLDKQLMDAFQKSGLTSYEQHKNLGRDYEYQPSYIPKQGKGPWYLTLAGMSATETVAKIIEVPDWEDFGFEKLYDKYMDDCNKGILTKTAAKARKEQMQKALEQQQALIQQLEIFHLQENDGEENTALLIEVWKKKRATMEKGLLEDLKDDCIPKNPALPPCEDFAPIYQQHLALCEKMALPIRVGDALKNQLADCLATGEKTLISIQEAIKKYQTIPNWQADTELQELVNKLEAQLIEQQQLLKQQQEQLESLPKECLKPIPLEIFFDGNSNSINKKNDAQIDKIAQLMISTPTMKMRLIGNTSIKIKNIDYRNPDTQENIETDHLMPDDELPEGWSEERKEKFRNRELTIRDLMMIRVERIKNLFIDKGVKSNQIECEAGQNLGKEGDSYKVLIEKQKVIVELF